MYSVIVAGSTHRTTQCAAALLVDGRFKLTLIITPEPKPVGRAQTITKNPLHQFADEHKIPIMLINKKVDQEIKNKIDSYCTTINSKPDFLLVVDFGYLVPAWLLQLPQIAPLNIHPSALPKWRGSSPGQFVLLNGETKSAVTLMVMNNQLDQGPIIYQKSFSVGPNWTQTEYYQHSFDLVCPELPQKMIDLAKNKIKPVSQPLLSPTPIAKRLTKEDSFVDWTVLTQVMNHHSDFDSNKIQELERATRAYSPWPGLWTLVPTAKGLKRMKILKSHVEQNRLFLDLVQIEGLQPTPWNEVKNMVM